MVNAQAAITILAIAAVGLTACAEANDADIAPEPTGTIDGTTTTAVGPTTTAADLAPTPTTGAPGTTTAITLPTTTAADASSPGSCVEQLDDIAQIAALVVWPAATPERWNEVTEAVVDHRVGGVVLFEPTDWDADELTARLADLEAASTHGLVVATDEEGGVVQRLGLLGDLASQRELGADVTATGLDVARSTIATHGELVRATGVDVVFGPVVDVAPASGEVPLAASRFFPGGPDDVALLADAYVQGWNDAGLIATLKHFPGHGAATADTHDAAATTPELAALRERDLVPYDALGERVADGDAFVMVGHLTVPGLTDGAPATRSPEAVELLRSIPGYDDALLITDALGMGAVGLDEADASVAALVAGLDVVIFTRTGQTGRVVQAIVDAVAAGELDEHSLRESASRVMRVLERDGHTCG